MGVMVSQPATLLCCHPSIASMHRSLGLSRARARLRLQGVRARTVGDGELPLDHAGAAVGARVCGRGYDSHGVPARARRGGKGQPITLRRCARWALFRPPPPPILLLRRVLRVRRASPPEPVVLSNAAHRRAFRPSRLPPTQAALPLAVVGATTARVRICVCVCAACACGVVRQLPTVSRRSGSGAGWTCVRGPTRGCRPAWLATSPSSTCGAARSGHLCRSERPWRPFGATSMTRFATKSWIRAASRRCGCARCWVDVPLKLHTTTNNNARAHLHTHTHQRTTRRTINRIETHTCGCSAHAPEHALSTRAHTLAPALRVHALMTPTRRCERCALSRTSSGSASRARWGRLGSWRSRPHTSSTSWTRRCVTVTRTSCRWRVSHQHGAHGGRRGGQMLCNSL